MNDLHVNKLLQFIIDFHTIHGKDFAEYHKAKDRYKREDLRFSLHENFKLFCKERYKNIKDNTRHDKYTKIFNKLTEEQKDILDARALELVQGW